MNKLINTICNNCGKHGHLFHQCKLPITSYGVIVFRLTSEGIQYLMIRRKDSFGYIDFIRGKYSPHNVYQLQNIVNEMSIYEKEKILYQSFDKLWIEMWGESFASQYKNEEISSSKKFELIKNGVMDNDKIITIKDIVEMSDTQWCETEWEFPKGRRNYKEKDLECAMREFEEETGILRSNCKSYKHKYFIAHMNHDDDLINYQKTEVSKIEWKTYEQCLESIRPYNLEKKNLITNINKVLQEYRLYS